MPARYKNPPIIEAVCDFRFDPSSPWDMAIPGLISDKVKSTNPKRQQFKAVEVSFSNQLQNVTQQATVEDRLRLLSEDEKSIIQIGRHLLAINRLAPYNSWESFLPTIKYAFDHYVTIAKPKSLSRVSLRYLNRITFEAHFLEMQDYFDFYPYLGPALPQTHSSFLVGVEFPYDNDRLRLQLQNAVLDEKDKIAFLMDLDHYTAKPGALEFDAVERWLTQAHQRVESVFEGSLREATRALFLPV